jgi:hypothetical protein
MNKRAIKVLIVATSLIVIAPVMILSGLFAYQAATKWVLVVTEPAIGGGFSGGLSSREVCVQRLASFKEEAERFKAEGRENLAPIAKCVRYSPHRDILRLFTSIEDALAGRIKWY